MDRRTFIASAAAAGAGFLVGNFRQDIADVWHNTAGASTRAPVPVLEMHFRALQATGWFQAEEATRGKILEATVVKAPYGMDRTWLDVSDGRGFVPGQLIAFLAPDGIYRSATIDTVQGQALRFQQSLADVIAVGSKLFNFYLNDAHPHPNGYLVIADDAAAQLQDGYDRWAQFGGFGFWDKSGNVSFADDSRIDYSNPGAAHHQESALKVTVRAVLEGIVSRQTDVPRGRYKLTLPVGFTGTTGNGTLLRVDIIAQDAETGESIVQASQRIRSLDGVALVTVPFTLKRDAKISIRAVVEDGAGVDMSVGVARIMRKSPHPVDLSTGTTVMLGDSWISSGVILRRFQTHWFPNAKFVQAGVGGNHVRHLLERFDADVIPHKPDNVVVLCGTNDAYRLPTVQEFQDQVAVLREKIYAIGARPIFWDCSVCYKDYKDGERLSPSRALATGTDFDGAAPYPTA